MRLSKSFSTALFFIAGLTVLAVTVAAQQQPPQQPYPAGQQQYPAQQPYPGQQQPYPADQQQQYPAQQPYPGQPPYPQQPAYTLPPPQDLDRLVDRIALDPDPLLSNILAAATFSDQIIDADEWAHRHTYLTGEALARAIQDDHLWFDPSVQALLPFPQVLEMMARDIQWTQALGDAFLANSGAVMDAVQRMRHRAYDYGYLRPTPQVMVRNGPYIEIIPADPNYLYVPYYNPAIVYAPPRPGFRLSLGISFGPGIILGAAYRPWGWYGGGNHFVWGEHRVFINDRPWGRTFANRGAYVHPYEVPRYAPRGPERRESHDRREAPQRGRRDDHRRDDHH